MAAALSHFTTFAPAAAAAGSINLNVSGWNHHILTDVSQQVIPLMCVCL